MAGQETEKATHSNVSVDRDEDGLEKTRGRRSRNMSLTRLPGQWHSDVEGFRSNRSKIGWSGRDEGQCEGALVWSKVDVRTSSCLEVQKKAPGTATIAPSSIFVALQSSVRVYTCEVSGHTDITPHSRLHISIVRPDKRIRKVDIATQKQPAQDCNSGNTMGLELPRKD